MAGRFTVQDEASQLVALLLGSSSSGQVLDLCAAPGGKATDLAVRATGAGRVLAADRSPGRLQLVRSNAARLGLAGLRMVVQDAARPALRPGRFDGVLLDAPCSGTGILRRQPEIRWRRQEADIDRLAGLQGILLRSAADLVRPGGVLVYSVCSVEPEEGTLACRSFLQGRPDFSVVPPAEGLAPDLVEEEAGLPHLWTLPHVHDVDGFFAVKMTRSDEAPLR